MFSLKSAGVTARTLFTPNEPITKRLYSTIAIAYLSLALVTWLVYPPAILPTVDSTLAAFPSLWVDQGLGYELWVSIGLNAQAVSIMTVVSLLVSYGTALAVLRPVASWFSAFRFNGFVGLPLLLTFMLSSQHDIKVTLLVIGMSVFTVPAIVSMIESMPREYYDHARVLRMGEWQVLWEVVVLGKFHEVLDILRTNMAVGWMMLPMVEGLFKTEGGIGALILAQNRVFKLEEVYCIIFAVIAVGIIQDYLVQVFKRLACPHAFINTERT